MMFRKISSIAFNFHKALLVRTLSVSSDGIELKD